MNLLYTTVTPAASLPVSLSDSKMDLRIEDSFTLDDDLISSYILAASKYCSEVVGKKLMSETLKISFDCFKSSMNLHFTPVTELVEIQYFDSDNVSQTLDSDDFYLYNFDNKTEIVFKDTGIIPAVYNRRDAVNITFITGMAATVGDIPETIIKAIRLLVVHWYENRSSTVVGFAINEIPMGVESLLSTERIGWVA